MKNAFLCAAVLGMVFAGSSVVEAGRHYHGYNNRGFNNYGRYSRYGVRPNRSSTGIYYNNGNFGFSYNTGSNYGYRRSRYNNYNFGGYGNYGGFGNYGGYGYGHCGY